MDKYRQILTKYWGHAQFRPLQEDIIRSVAEEGKDTLGLLPTGGGKSIIFQVPALAIDGICIVITPLIALMKDQVENLKKRGIKAMAIYSGMTKDEIDIALNNAIFGDFKFLYISPERLETDLFKTRVLEMRISLVAIDEAHCISQWGYDFRPSYLKIAELRKLVPDVPYLALTATATPEVVDDIQDKLLFKQKNVFRKSFERKNLIYVVRNVPDKINYLLKIIGTLPNATGIVYTRSRKKTKEVSEFLNQNGISADYYHAGLPNDWKDKKQREWMSGQTKIIVATNAFGMGIDKPDVRFVAHIDVPDSLEAYFQEAGRAGRDEKKAYSILLYDENDKQTLEKNIDVSFPERDVIKNIYNALGNYFQLPVGGGKDAIYDFNIMSFSINYKLNHLVVYNALKILQAAGYIEVTDELENPSKVRFIVSRDDLYKFQVANLRFDAFIKLVLRTYSGVFSDYVRIDEQFLAKRSNLNVQEIKKYLYKLMSLGIIYYIPQKKTPLLIYTEERLDDKSLVISQSVYEDRKKRYQNRVSAVIAYISSTTKCRSQMLLHYFGDESAARCGQCDICTKRNELDMSKYEFDMILDHIKEVLKTNAVKIERLVRQIPVKEDKVLKVIKWLTDNSKIIPHNDGTLSWNS